MHEHHGNGPSMLIPLLLVTLITVAYLSFAWKQRSGHRLWSMWRTAAFTAGSATLALGLLPALLPFGHGDFRNHMLQHLLVGMLAPIGLVLGAPVTLALRTLPIRGARLLVSLLRSHLVRFVANPAIALILNLGGMAALYFTPLYTQMMNHPALHYLVHFHFVAAGCLYTWVICGPDPGPHRPSVPIRLATLGVAVVIHSVLAQLLYSGTFVSVPATAAELQQGAAMMYYGGDITEMLLAVALVSTWRPARAARMPTTTFIQ